MKTLIVIAHPNTGKSFNHALADQAKKTLEAKGHQVVVLDLYADRFDPVLPLNEEKKAEDDLPPEIREAMQYVREADGMIFIHPNWWGTPPAILKGWIDRVLRQGFAYKFSDQGPVQLLTDKTVQVFSTSNTPKEVEENVYHEPLENFWKTIVFGLCGAKSFERRNFESIIMSSPEDRANWLKEVEETVNRRF
ncbi:MAG: NAD(P)H-dependent oxidoreductase [Planctomycetia bacterium]|nr:NAD(P)H-dependent oxidoreductase [Planctomycetia bacterium]